MCWIEEWGYDDDKQETFCTGNYFVRPIDYVWDDKYLDYIPAWSMHRLLCLYNCHYLEFMGEEEIASVYDVVIEAIESAIMEGYFNKEYLENDKARTQR